MSRANGRAHTWSIRGHGRRALRRGGRALCAFDAFFAEEDVRTTRLRHLLGIRCGDGARRTAEAGALPSSGPPVRPGAWLPLWPRLNGRSKSSFQGPGRA